MHIDMYQVFLKAKALKIKANPGVSFCNMDSVGVGYAVHEKRAWKTGPQNNLLMLKLIVISALLFA